MTKSGQNNNGYVPYVDYARDYSPPPSQLQRNFNNTLTTSGSGNSYSTHLSLATSNNALTSQSVAAAQAAAAAAAVTHQLNGQLPGGNLSLTRNRPELRQDNGLPSIQNSMNSIPNVLLGECRHHWRCNTGSAAFIFRGNYQQGNSFYGNAKNMDKKTYI